MLQYMRNIKNFGGLLSHGIPDFRLPRNIINDTIGKIIDIGVKVELGKEIGKDISLDELKQKYDAVLLTFGANVSSKMHIEGEDKAGVFGANELLEYENFPDFYGKNVVVVGGGNTAIDVARTVNKKEAKNVYVLYRRGRAQMPAEDKEIDEAISEGIVFLYQINPIKILGEDKVCGVEALKTKLIETPGERPRPVNIEGSNCEVDADYVIMALGSKPNKDTIEMLGLETNDWGYIKVDDNYETSQKGVFSAGDLMRK